MAKVPVERRSEPRRELFGWVEGLLLDFESNDPTFHFQCPTRDISESGLGVWIAAAAPIGSPVAMLLKNAPSDSGSLRYGTVRSVEPHNEWFALGIRFDRPCPESLRDVPFAALVRRMAA